MGSIAPQYGALVGGMREEPTIEGDYIYFGTGSTRGMIKANRHTGDTVWTRSTVTGTPLPGAAGSVVYGTSVVIGNGLYFGNNAGAFFALDKTTGANLYFTQLYADLAHTLTVGVLAGPSSDGTNLFVGTYGALTTSGTIYSLTPGVGSFTVNWDYVIPAGVLAVLPGGFFAAPTFRCDNLFINSYSPVMYNGWRGIRQNLDPLTGIEKWPDYYLMGETWSAPVATIGGYKPLAIFANINNGYSGSVNSRAIRAVNFSNSTVWINPGTSGAYDNNSFVHATTTCDPYVIYGTYDQSAGDGHWRIADGNTGEILVDYFMPGVFVEGTAVAHGISDGLDWLVVATRNTAYTAGPAKLFAFKVGGPRPRMIVPESIVLFDAVNTSDPAVVSRTDNDAVLNIGCAPLIYTGTLVAGAPLKTRVSSVNSQAAKGANNLASRLVDVRVEDMLYKHEPLGSGKFAAGSMTLDENGELYLSSLAVKPVKANSSQLAPPSWVAWQTPAVFPASLGGGGSQAFTFDLTRAGMILLGQNYFYVDIMSNDPDYYVEAGLPQPDPQATIEYDVPYVYCVVDTGRMKFGVTGGEWYSNRGEFGDGALTFTFTLDGSSDGTYLYEGTMFFMTSMNDAAWNPFGSSVPKDFGYLWPFYVTGTTCGSCNPPGGPIPAVNPVQYTTNNGVSYANMLGDLCSFAMIDSGQAGGFWPHQAGPSIGVMVKFREVGAYGPDFGDFKLVVVDVFNRSSINPLNGLYAGSFEDWDVASGSNNGNGDIAKGFVFINDGAIVRGQIGLPRSGSYWPDGTKTDPMYNAQINSNSDVVYPSAPCPECLLDSLYRYIDGHPEGALSFTASASPSGTPDDLSYEVAFSKMNLAAGGSKSYGFAMWGSDNSASPLIDMDNRSKFINKFAGFARGDVDNNDIIDLRDLVRLQRFIHSGGPGPAPFMHLGDVNNDGLVNDADCTYMRAYFFLGGPPPKSAFKF